MDPDIELIGESTGISAVRERIRRLLPPGARRLAPVLLNGETGTGKGLLARLLHRQGPRRDGPFVDVNCAAIPENLLEAEMFGFERGAFTDARQAKPGLFQAAHGGTIFLDEIGLLPEALQAKLLKVIEERMVRRLGSTRSEPVDAWIVTATNEDLGKAVRERRFREDLYHRLAVVTLPLPPLRERGRDVLLLAERFLARACADYSLTPKQLGADAQAALLGYRWPGNIRELSNVIERVALLSDAPVVTAAMLELPEAEIAAAPEAGRGEAPDERDEREIVLEALRATSWNVSRAAARLGISRNTIRYRIEKHRLRPGAPPSRERRPQPSAPVTAPPPAVESATVSVPPVVRWERRRITFLRAMVLAPEHAVRTDPSRVLEILVDKARSFGGGVGELSPAAVVAVFGLEPSEDAPRRAANAAMAIQAGVKRAPSDTEHRWSVKIGVHVAEVLVGRVDGTTEIDHDAKREVWSVLEELLGRAAADAIVVSEAAAPFLERHFELVAAGDDPPGIYSLSGRERAGLGLGGRMARFVGRRHELELLRSRFESATRGQGQVVGVAGEAGIGKSRLLFEFRRSLAGERVTYLEAHCLSYGSAIPYLPVLEMLRASCKIADMDSPPVVAEKVRIALAEFAMGPTEGAAYLLHLLGIKDDTDWVADLDPQTIQGRIFETLRQMSLMGSRAHPLILVIEDLHWVDAISEEYFASLVEVLAAARVLVVTTYRSGYHPRWMAKSYATQISLQPLAPEDSHDVVRSVLGTDGIAPSVAELVVAKAEGNPFFLEELARAVREQGHLAPRLEVPDTIEEVILARIDRLGPEEKRLLQSAAVIGKNVPWALLQIVVDLTETALRDGLVHLQRSEFLYETAAGRERDYTFRHALTHEVAYESLLPEQRRALHARIVEAIERLHEGRRAEYVERLADHALRAELWEKAVGYLREAGTKAVARSAHRDAVARFEQALTALGHLPPSRAVTETAIDVRFDLRNPLHLLGEFDRLLDHLRETRSLAEAIDDQWRLGWAFSYLTQGFRLTGNADHAIQCGQRAIALAESRQDFPLEVATEFHLGSAYEDLGDYRRASVILRKVVERLQGDLIYERFGLSGLPSVVARAHLVCCLAELGEFAEGFDRGQEAIQIAEAVDDPHGLINAYFGVATVSILKGEFGQAIPRLERALEICQSSNVLLMFPRLAASLGFVYALSGRVSAGIPLLEQAVQQATSMKLMNMYSTFLAWLGETYVIAERMEDAVRLGEQALQRSREQKDRGHEAYALRLIGDFAARQDPPDLGTSEEHYHRAIATAGELGMRPLLGRCHLALGRLYARAGQHTSAKQQLALAVGLFHHMSMQFWLEQSAAELKRLG